MYCTHAQGVTPGIGVHIYTINVRRLKSAYVVHTIYVRRLKSVYVVHTINAFRLESAYVVHTINVRRLESRCMMSYKQGINLEK